LRSRKYRSSKSFLVDGLQKTQLIAQKKREAAR
jgi:hypothetical protein